MQEKQLEGAFFYISLVAVYIEKDVCVIFYRKFHSHFKEQTLADLRKNKLDVVVTTFETCRDNVVCNP